MNTEKTHKFKVILESLIYFFPVQLMLVHFKRNILLIGIWLLLFGYVSQQMGSVFGIPNLFLSPEYISGVSFLSFLLLGFSVGGFIMAFHIYSYVTFGPNFQFIATMSRPFYKFCVNNSLIPALFIIVHLINIYDYQLVEELQSKTVILGYMGGYFIGIFLFIAASIFYFFITNKDLFKISGKNEDDFDKESATIQTVLSKKYDWETLFTKKKEYRVDYYFAGIFKIKKARDAAHYDESLLKKVFDQHHLNISIFEVAVIITFFIFGTFREVDFFMVPAGISVMVLFTMIVMIYSALFSWLKGWTLFIVLVSFIGFNYLSLKFEFNQYKNFAYGMDYTADPAEYTKDRLEEIYKDTAKLNAEKNQHLGLLKNWHNKIYEDTGDDKPYFIVVNTSGGGLRSAYWTFLVLRELQKRTDDKFFSNVNFVTGASGGMIGAAYFRELYLRQVENKGVDIQDEKYLDNIGKDLLNHVAFTIATNDLFIRFLSFKDGAQKYPKDRGYAFEWQINQNTEYVLNKRLGSYTSAEYDGKIPMMVFTPTIINDGRRLVMSSQPLSFLSSNQMFDNCNFQASQENVDYQSVFKNQNPANIRFTTVLRMNATFPYILPMVSMPSKPRMDIMDAGIRDNYGTKLTWRYLYAMREWILNNTSGVIYLKIRDNKKDFDINPIEKISLFDRLLRPFGNFYSNFPRTQDYDQDELTLLGKEWLGEKLKTYTLYLKENPNEPVALSWHLTSKEKKIIIETLQSERINDEITKILENFPHYFQK